MSAVRSGLMFLLLCGLPGCLVLAQAPPTCIDADCSGGNTCDTGGFCMSDCYENSDCKDGYYCCDGEECDYNYECRERR